MTAQSSDISGQIALSLERARIAAFELAHLCDEMLRLARGEPSRIYPDDEPICRAEFLCEMLRVSRQTHSAIIAAAMKWLPVQENFVRIASEPANNYHEAVVVLAAKILDQLTIAHRSAAVEIELSSRSLPLDFSDYWPKASAQLALREPPDLVFVQAALQRECENAIRKPSNQSKNHKSALSNTENECNSLVGFLGGTDLAEALGIHAAKRDAFFQQLKRQRKGLGDDCWHEVLDARPNSPRFLYRADAPKLRDLAEGYKTPKPGEYKTPKPA